MSNDSDHELDLSLIPPSVVWPLVPWIVYRILYVFDPLELLGQFDPEDLIRDGGRSQAWREILWWDYGVTSSSADAGREAWQRAALSPSWRRKFRRRLKEHILALLDRMIHDPWWGRFLEEFHRRLLMFHLTRLLRDRLVSLVERSREPVRPTASSFRTLMGQLEEAWRHPEVASKALPPGRLVGPREAATLLEELGPEGYGHVLHSMLWQVLRRPGTLSRPPLRRDKPQEIVEGEPPPNIRQPETPEEAAALVFEVAWSWVSSSDILDTWLRLRIGGA